MRTRITQKAWFGPKTGFGWGWRITSWEGLVTTLTLFALMALSAALWRASAVLPIVGLSLIYLLVVLLTGDPPGGPPLSGR